MSEGQIPSDQPLGAPEDIPVDEAHGIVKEAALEGDALYPSYNRYYHPERYTDNEFGAAGVKTQALASALKQWQIVENALKADGPWMLGNRFSACDIYLQMITTWHEPPAKLWDQFSAVREVAAGVVARTGCQRAIKRHNFGTGFLASPSRE